MDYHNIAGDNFQMYLFPYTTFNSVAPWGCGGMFEIAVVKLFLNVDAISISLGNSSRSTHWWKIGTGSGKQAITGTDVNRF